MAENMAIVEKIIADANGLAKVTLDEARIEAAKIIENAKQSSAEQEKRETEAIKKDCHLIIERRQTVATLDGRKISLRAKQSLISECFDHAIKKILELDSKKYLAYIKSLISKYGENGDEVVLSTANKTVTKAFIEETVKELGLAITVSKNTSDYRGGIILQTKVVDKNLTLETTLRGLKEEIEQETAEILFG